MTPTEQKPSMSIHSLEVKLKRIQRSRDLVINKYDELLLSCLLTEINGTINDVTKSIIPLKEQELESLKNQKS